MITGLNGYKVNIKEKKNKIIDWLKSYAQDSNRIFVVGVSGGIDSALTSTLCAEAGMRTVVVSMPIYQQMAQAKLRQRRRYRNRFNVCVLFI